MRNISHTHRLRHLPLDLQTLRDENLILLESISGSRAYGLNRAGSDTDIRGVFYLPEQMFYGLTYVSQVSNANNDIVFYELRRFVELLSKNNPNILELLAVPEDCLIYRHPILERLTPELFLSKLCKDSFAGYAMTQIKKARGLNKKVLNPMEKERKSLLHFCYVAVGQGSKALVDWLEEKGIRQEDCGLVNVSHMRNMFALFHDPKRQFGYRGIISGPSANEVQLSSIPKEEEPLAYVSVNHDGYTRYCKDHREYWEWVEKRNEARYQATLAHGKRYDAKNMMHTFRLLAMAEEILSEGKLLVRRPDREALWEIRDGSFDFEELIARAKAQLRTIEKAYGESSLPERPDLSLIERMLVEMRQELYE